MPRNSRKQPRKCGKRSLGSDLCSFDKRVLRRRRRRARMDTIRFICGADLPPASAATRIRRSTARQPPSDSERHGSPVVPAGGAAAASGAVGPDIDPCCICPPPPTHHSHHCRRSEMVSQLDESVGTVLDALRETGMLNNSIVVGRLRAPRTPYAHPLHVSDWAATLLAAADEAAPDHPPSDDGDGDIFAGVSHWHALSAPADEEVPAPRESLLLNVDDVIGLSGVLAGRWKYVEGTHDSGAYDGHLGAPARGAPYPAYDAQATADAARALGLDDNVTAADVLRTLAAGAVSCNGLQEDPCETRDASAQQPAQLQRLRALLGAFRAQQAPQLNAPVDPRADPALHGGVWAPWLDGEDEDEVDGIDR
ncbi:uncharacterized protein GBIM_14425, partial [Gryllus bimaculatus]